MIRLLWASWGRSNGLDPHSLQTLFLEAAKLQVIAFGKSPVADSISSDQICFNSQ